jgi:hypothetical protein
MTTETTAVVNAWVKLNSLPITGAYLLQNKGVGVARIWRGGSTSDPVAEGANSDAIEHAPPGGDRGTLDATFPGVTGDSLWARSLSGSLITLTY